MFPQKMTIRGACFMARLEVLPVSVMQNFWQSDQLYLSLGFRVVRRVGV